jgi:hypothetical protein
MDDVDKILDLLVWFYSRAKFTVVWHKAASNDPIPLNLLDKDEQACVVKNSLLNILSN